MPLTLYATYNAYISLDIGFDKVHFDDMVPFENLAHEWIFLMPYLQDKKIFHQTGHFKAFIEGAYRVRKLRFFAALCRVQFL